MITLPYVCGPQGQSSMKLLTSYSTGALNMLLYYLYILSPVRRTYTKYNWVLVIIRVVSVNFYYWLKKGA